MRYATGYRSTRCLSTGKHYPSAPAAPAPFWAQSWPWAPISFSDAKPANCPTHIIIILFGFTALWALDGLNSFVTDLTPLAGVYQPHNWLLLLTGTLNGLMMASMLYPIAMQTFWREHHPQRALRDFRDLGLLLLLGLAAVVLVLLNWYPILYLAALLSSAGVLVMLTLVNTIILLILTQRENRAESWRDMLLPLLGGLALSVALVGAIGLVRYALTGTLSSLPGLSL